MPSSSCLSENQQVTDNHTLSCAELRINYCFLGEDSECNNILKLHTQTHSSCKERVNMLSSFVASAHVNWHVGMVFCWCDSRLLQCISSPENKLLWFLAIISLPDWHRSLEINGFFSFSMLWTLHVDWWHQNDQSCITSMNYFQWSISFVKTVPHIYRRNSQPRMETQTECPFCA